MFNDVTIFHGYVFNSKFHCKSSVTLVFRKLTSFALKGESGLVGKGVTFRIGRIPVQTPLGARPGFETQPRYEAPDDHWDEIGQTQ